MRSRAAGAFDSTFAHKINFAIIIIIIVIIIIIFVVASVSLGLSLSKVVETSLFRDTLPPLLPKPYFVCLFRLPSSYVPLPCSSRLPSSYSPFTC